MSETVTLYKCGKCRCIIQDPEDGVVVQGNIYVADPNERGGLVGNNFPVEDGETSPKFNINAVEESVYCQKCFLSIVFPKLKIQAMRGLFDG